MEWDSVQQVFRMAIGWGAAALVTAGVVDQANSVVLVGAAMGLVQVGWWWYWNKFRKAAVK